MEFRNSYGEFSPIRYPPKSMQAIKEEEEEDDDTRRELHVHQPRIDGSKSPTRYVPHSEDGRSEAPTIEESPRSLSPTSNSPVFRRAKRSNSIKSLNPTMEFPVLVRGIDMEARNFKSASLALKEVDIGYPQKKQRPNESRNKQSQNEALPKNSEENQFKLVEIDSFEEGSDNGQGTLSIFQIEESIGANELNQEVYNIQNLQALLSDNKPIKPEEVLYLAIHDNQIEAPLNKSTIWNKLGFKDKKFEAELMDRALKE